MGGVKALGPSRARYSLARELERPWIQVEEMEMKEKGMSDIGKGLENYYLHPFGSPPSEMGKTGRVSYSLPQPDFSA